VKEGDILVVDAIMILAEQNIPSDVQHLLVMGSPDYDVPPGTLDKVVAAIRADERAKVIEECAKAIRACPSLDESGYIVEKDAAIRALKKNNNGDG